MSHPGLTPAPEFVGLHEEEARGLAANRGMHVRIAVRDGEAFVLTGDLRSDRVNVVIRQHVVEHAFIG